MLGACWQTSDADIALLQEASKPPADVAAKFEVNCAPWQTGRSQPWRTAVVQLSSHAEVQWIEAKPLADAEGGELGVSRPGTLAAAVITPLAGEKQGPIVRPFAGHCDCAQKSVDLTAAAIHVDPGRYLPAIVSRPLRLMRVVGFFDKERAHDDRSAISEQVSASIEW